MFRHITVVTALAFAMVVTSQPGLRAQVPTPEALAASEEAQDHIAEAMALAGSDLVREAQAHCSAAGPRRAALVRRAAGLPPVEDYVVEPTRLFENLYYIGFSGVGAWAIDTSEGLILIDTLHSPDDARDVLVPGLEKSGLDPTQIKYVIVGHGHNDHVGGASYLQQTYGARILISELDWELALSGETPERPRPERDMVVTDGQRLTLGDTTVTMALAPGHTPGTLAMFVPVRHLGRTHTALIFSGTQMPNQESIDTFRHVFDDFARPLQAETALGGHPGVADLDEEQLERCLETGGPCWTQSMNTLELMEQLRGQYPAGPHPLLLGPERFDRYLSIMLECASARLAAVQAQTDESLSLWAPIPEWAYGYDTQPEPGDTPPIPTPGNRALQPGEDAEELRRPLTLEGSSATFSRQEIRHAQDVIDWFPGDYPPMADIIKYGPESLQGGAPDWACGSCHLPNGKGRPSNAPVAGKPAAYLVQQIHDMRNGLRYSADPRKPNTPNMIRMARAMTEEEIQESAEFWAAVPWTTRRYFVQEADLIPEMYLNPDNNMFFTVGTEPTEPLDGRIVETPVDTYQADYLRNPRMGFNVYVPVGSIAKGEELVLNGGDGKTVACAICHGQDLMGLAVIPGIAGRSPSYLMRQLYDFKQGTRNGVAAQLMQPTIANLTLEDMTNIVAYLASIGPTAPAPGNPQQD